MQDSNGRDLLEMTLNALPTGLFVCDAQGIIRFINTAYADYLDTTPEQALGKHITELIPDSGIPDVIKSGTAKMGTWRVFHHSGREQHILVNRVPIRDAHGNIAGGFSITLLDTPEQMQSLLSDLEEMNTKVTQYARKMKSALSSTYTLDSILGVSEAMRTFKRYLSQYARTESPVLILGSTGTGKELAAGAVHSESRRADGPFVCLNCAAIPGELFESELFGYVPGAFSGAHKDGKVGMVELADRGTLFLDEIGDMPLRAQVKLLRLLEEKRVVRLGATQARTLDFRLVAATNRDLPAMIQTGSFREDLYYRINPMTLHLPALKERKEDIMPLVTDVLKRMNAAHVRCTDAAVHALHNYPWPGNVRELRNTVMRALCLCQNNTITVGDLPQNVLQPALNVNGDTPGCLQQRMGEQQAQAILSALREQHWNVVKTAVFLGISRASLYEKMKKYGIQREKNV